MPSDNVLRSVEGPIVILTLDRPERRNALSLELMLDLLACLDEVDGSDAIRAVLIASTGSVLSSGHDVSEMTGANRPIIRGCSTSAQS